VQLYPTVPVIFVEVTTKKVKKDASILVQMQSINASLMKSLKPLSPLLFSLELRL
jgi:hypothetical protein